MALQASTGLRNKLLDTNSLRSIFNLGFLEIYGGSVPTSPDGSISGSTLLVRISNNNTATGLTFAASAASGAITKNLSETWSKAAAATGTATFWRFVAAGDTGVLSTTEARIQGTIGLAGADLNTTSLSYTSATVYTIDAFAISLPSL